MSLRFQVAGIEVEVRFKGKAPELLGYYAHYPPCIGAEPDLIVHAEVQEIAHRPSAKDPGFVVTQVGNGLHFHRNDVQGAYERQDGRLVGHFTLPPWPTGLEAILRIGVSLLLPERQGLLLHSAAVADERGAFVFSGVSGAGKSTISSLISENHAATKVSDELLILQKNPQGWELIVTPFAGCSGLPWGTRWPLHSLYLLQQAAEHAVSPLSAIEAMPAFSRNVVNFGRSAQSLDALLHLSTELIETHPPQLLRFAKDPNVGNVLGFTVVDERVGGYPGTASR